MARTANATKTATPAAPKRKPGRPAAAKKTPAKSVATPKRARIAAPSAPKLSKDELRAQVEKLELATTTLRSKNREANRAMKAATVRIAELEDQVAQLEKRLAAQAAPAKRAPKSPSVPRANRRSKIAESADTTTAVEAPSTPDVVAETAPETPEEHPGEE